ncbi:hypothetical protein BGZ65_005255 [Modicella reniformis]|uniref:F-box domain-containing protein n=1 Tax=Modicella reniformis TaxID=1440133 RepID=A0A9P6SPV4_9FUNG|nr:hypothetical protein BGZ65_005255 [Modicella reniformis]
MSASTATAQRSRDKLFALPEICKRISRSLDNKTIASCSRVSRAWNTSWLPIIWHTIDAGQQWHDLSFQESLGKHGDLIRILKCVRYDNISLLFNADHILCRNLVTLVLPMTTLANQADHARLLRQNPLLRNLSLCIWDASSRYTILIDAIGDLRFLNRLAFDENKTLQTSTLETILSRCNDSLRELSFKGTYFIKHPFGTGEGFASGLMATSDSGSLSKDEEIEIKETFGILSLYMDNIACMQDLVLNLGSRFPQLNSLSLRESVEVNFGEDFPDRLAKRCPRIKHLDISYTDMDDAGLANLIKAFPGLRTFHAAETRLGDKSLAALVEGCRYLTVLDINTTYNPGGYFVQRLLERCWELRKLDAWDVSVNVGQMMEEARRSRTSDTRTLASVDSSIVQSGYSSQQDPQGRWASGALFQEDMDSPQGYEPGSDGEVLDEDNNMIWIDYSFSSGLGLLARLKDLHTLCLHSTSHAIGVPEIVWMSRNWPNLRRIEGLHEDEDEEVVQWLRDNRPDIEIDGDI